MDAYLVFAFKKKCSRVFKHSLEEYLIIIHIGQGWLQLQKQNFIFLVLAFIC